MMPTTLFFSIFSSGGRSRTPLAVCSSILIPDFFCFYIPIGNELGLEKRREHLPPEGKAMHPQPHREKRNPAEQITKQITYICDKGSGSIRCLSCGKIKEDIS